MPSDYSRVSLDDHNDDDNDHNNHGGRQQQLMEQQDAGLEMLGQSAVRLGQMSLQISEELEFQNQMLTDMDDQLETAQEELDIVTRQTQAFIRASGGTRNCVVIAVLSVTVVVLIFLILYF